MATDSSATATGVVTRFYVNTGYGFIKPDSSVSDDDDLFVHYTEIQSKGHRILQEGQKVRFSVSVKNDKKQAVNVNVLDGSNIEGRDGSRDDGRRLGFRGNGNVCYTCGDVDHMAKDCERGFLGGNGACHICGEDGHMARDCHKNLSGLHWDYKYCYQCCSCPCSCFF